MSYCEDLCEKSLKLIFFDDVEIFRNYRPNWLKNPKTGRNLEIDFYIPKLQIAIEIQGEHHYDDHEQIKRDLIKKEILQTFNVYLMAISITQISPNFLYTKITQHCNINNKYSYLKIFNKEWLKGLEYKSYKIGIKNKYENSECLISPAQHEIMDESRERLDKIFIKIKNKKFFYIFKNQKVQIIPLTRIKKSTKCRIDGTNTVIMVKMKKILKQIVDI